MKNRFVFLILVICAGLCMTWGVLRVTASQSQLPAQVTAPIPPRPETSTLSNPDCRLMDPRQLTPAAACLDLLPRDMPGWTNSVADGPSSFYHWQLVDSPDHARLNQISMVNASDGWAVGEYGTIMHWDGSSWQFVFNPIIYDLYGIDMLSPSDGWAVGGFVRWQGDVSVILHWDGNTWQPVYTPTELPLKAVTMLSPTDGWIVGGRAQQENVILHWDGSVWSIVPSEAPASATLYAIDMVSATDGWAVGSAGTFLHWDGSLWKLVSSPTTDYLMAIDMLSSNDGWAVGGPYNTGVILHWDGSSWQIASTPQINFLYDVSAVSSNDVWAIDNSGEQMLHWDGASWSITYNPYYVYSLEMLSATDGWAAGDVFLHYIDFNGLTVYVENASGQPAYYAYVEAYSSDGQYADQATTGKDGYVYLNVPPGTYNLVAYSNFDYFGIFQTNVTSPDTITLSAMGTTQVTLTAKKRDGGPLDQLWIFVGVSGGDYQQRLSLGPPGFNGVYVFNITPGFFDVGLVDLGNYYFVYTLNQDLTGPSGAVDFDMSTNPSAELVVGHPFDNASALSIFPRDGNLSGYKFYNLTDGTHFVLSANHRYYAEQFIERSGVIGYHWVYKFLTNPVDNFYNPGDVFTSTVGGTLAVTGRTEDATVGSWITLTDEPVDSFGSLLSSIYTYTYVSFPPPSTYYSQTVAPQVQLTDPEGNVTLLDTWWYNLPPTATTGLYDVSFEWNTGAYQGWVSADSQFEVVLQETSAVIPVEGGSLFSPWDDTLYEFPPGTFTDTVIVTHTVRYTDIPPDAPWVDIRHFFDVTAVYSSTGLPAEPTQPFTITIGYTDLEKGVAIEDSLGLYHWDGAQWVPEPTSLVDPVNNQLVATPSHFSTWGILGETNRTFISIINR